VAVSSERQDSVKGCRGERAYHDLPSETDCLARPTGRALQAIERIVQIKWLVLGQCDNAPLLARRQPTRRRERKIHHLRSAGSAQKFLSSCAVGYMRLSPPKKGLKADAPAGRYRSLAGEPVLRRARLAPTFTHGMQLLNVEEVNMKTIAQFVRTTIVGGVFFLAPIVVLIVILAKAFDFAKKGLNAVLIHFPAASELGPGAATALSITILALVCLLAGLVAHTVIAKRLVDALESSLLSRIPGYDYLKQESASALGVAEIAELPVVFVPMEGGWQLGVQTEALSGGLVSIFVPGAPDPHSGAVFFFSTDNVRPAGIKLVAALNCLRRCGAGASALGAKWPIGA